MACGSFIRILLQMFVFIQMIPLGYAAASGQQSPEKSAPMESWQKICQQYQNAAIPVGDRPSAKIVASLKECSSYDLFYGFDQPAEPVKARQCAFVEIDRKKDDGPFAGDAMLAAIYANGVGAGRNLPLAIRFACKMDGAPAEMEGRIAHLEQLRKENWTGSNFSICDDITSGYMQGFCADHFDRFKKIKRDRKSKEIRAGLTAGEQAEFARLRKAATRYFDSRTDNEVDQSGTARSALVIDENASLENGFFQLFDLIRAGKLPVASAEKYKAADADLNAVYGSLHAAKEPEWGTVTKTGVKKTQREWIRYRDAWALFCSKKFPNASPYSIKTWLTLKRTEMLKEFGI